MAVSFYGDLTLDGLAIAVIVPRKTEVAQPRGCFHGHGFAGPGDDLAGVVFDLHVNNVHPAGENAGGEGQVRPALFHSHGALVGEVLSVESVSHDEADLCAERARGLERDIKRPLRERRGADRGLQGY